VQLQDLLIDVYKSLLIEVLTNPLGVIICLVIFTIFLLRGLNLSKAVSYCSFFLAGSSVAHLQWLIITNADPDEIGWYIFFAIVWVALFAMAGFLIYIRYLRDDPLLFTIVCLTLGLAVFQFGGVHYGILNWYARGYASICLTAPFIKLALEWNKQR
jgi:hypothetical protein